MARPRRTCAARTAIKYSKYCGARTAVAPPTAARRRSGTFCLSSERLHAMQACTCGSFQHSRTAFWLYGLRKSQTTKHSQRALARTVTSSLSIPQCSAPHQTLVYVAYGLRRTHVLQAPSRCPVASAHLHMPPQKLSPLNRPHSKALCPTAWIQMWWMKLSPCAILSDAISHRSRAFAM